MRRRTGFWWMAVAGLLVAVGCNRSEPEGSPPPSSSAPAQRTPAGSATASASARALDQDYAQMGQMYGQMANQYGHMGPAMAADARWMDQMQAQMARLHQYMPMMGPGYGRGTMGPGMMGRGMGRGMMGGSAMGVMGSWMSGMDRWHDQMAQMNDRWASEAEKSGHPEVAQLHRQAAQLHRKAAQDIEAQAKGSSPEAATAQLDGGALYAVTCAACHGPEGRGVPGAFPSLAGNALLDGPAAPVIHIVRSGLTGPIQANGLSYNGAMPSFQGRLSSAQLAAILSYVRSAWGNHGGPVTQADIEGPSS